MTGTTLPLREFTAAKGAVVHNGKILFLRESGSYVDGSNPGKYDTPGGRLNPGEGWIDGIKREVFEETGLKVETAAPFFTREWRVTRATEEWHIRAVFFAIPMDADQVTLSMDHDHYVWVDPRDAATQIPILPGYDAMLTALQARCPELFQHNQKVAA